MLRDELPVVEGRALSAGVRMLRDEIPAAESWALSDGVACPGIVNFYFVHNVKLNGEFCQHAFAVVWRYKADSDQGYFGKPAQVWKPFDYKPCGPSLFMPVQRIWKKFACCSMKINDAEKLVVSPIPRLFH